MDSGAFTRFLRLLTSKELRFAHTPRGPEDPSFLTSRGSNG